MTPEQKVVKRMPRASTREAHTLTQAQEESMPLSIEDDRLDVLRPNPALVKRYVSRSMPGGKKDIDYLMDRWERRENVMFVGDTQGGKTMVVNVMAVLIGERMGLGKPVPVFTLSASNGITDYDLFGQPTAWTNPDTGSEHLVWLPGTVDMSCRVGGILYLDEVNMMPERVTSSLHPITDWRRTFTNRAKAVKVPGDGFMPEVVKAHDDLWIVGTMNPNYRGAGQLNEAFTNRFRHLEWGYDPTVENKLIPNEAVRSLGEALRVSRQMGHVRTPVGTATLMRMADDCVTDGVDMAIYSLMSMFTVDEKPKVDEIITSRSFRTLLANAAEGLSPLAGSTAGWPDVDPDDSPF